MVELKYPIKGQSYSLISSTSVYFMQDLAKHGPYYACCQAVLYLFAFRHAELCDTETKLETLRALALDWQRVNPHNYVA